ncbi:hypothetical protein SAMN05216207_102648 [Pseudonocardia ammonioxydans]|uniref:Uncharacterized protein n=1 Tax=Pseudonocardia ammonioxydans TaxID=260086 RepID=A0A1I5DH08_PSUAM|nr:hypothetical protein [Pseudonocardia ammonioxydans]SFN98564.1 hypothetical protein SAMN05216207_102648 [Pseudonocardia ammonioxydans]
MFRAAPQRPEPARTVVLAALLMVLLAAATITSVPAAPVGVTLLLALAAFSVRPLVVLHHRHAAGRVTLSRR